MFRYLLLATVLVASIPCQAGGDAKNMTTHEIRVKADWNCKSAQGWCAEDQAVPYNKCKCAQRMCDAAQRASEAAERGYDSGAACLGGSSFCEVSKSAECQQILAGGRPSGSDGTDSGYVPAQPCEKQEGQICINNRGECTCSGSTPTLGTGATGNAKGLSCDEVKKRAAVHKSRCEAGNQQACKDYKDRAAEAERCDAEAEAASGTGNAKGLSCDEVKKRAAVHKSRCEAGNQQACKDYKDRAAEAERCDKEREKASGTGNAKGDSCSTVIKKAQIHKANCEKGNKQACKDYEDRRKEAERCGADTGAAKTSSSSKKNMCKCFTGGGQGIAWKECECGVNGCEYKKRCPK